MVDVALERCKISVPVGHFLFSCSDTFAVRSIV